MQLCRLGAAVPRLAAEQPGSATAARRAEVVRDYAAHLAVHRHVSASTQNQALCAILFLCREVLGVDVESLSPAPSQAGRAPAGGPQHAGNDGAARGHARDAVADGGAHLRRRAARARNVASCASRISTSTRGWSRARRQGRQRPIDVLAEVGRDELRAHLRKCRGAAPRRPRARTRRRVDARGAGPQVPECGS